MGQLMSNHHTDAPKVKGRRTLRVKEWRLENASGKHNFVSGWLVVRIDSRWCLDYAH